MRCDGIQRPLRQPLASPGRIDGDVGDDPGVPFGIGRHADDGGEHLVLQIAELPSFLIRQDKGQPVLVHRPKMLVQFRIGVPGAIGRKVRRLEQAQTFAGRRFASVQTSRSITTGAWSLGRSHSRTVSRMRALPLTTAGVRPGEVHRWSRRSPRFDLRKSLAR